MSVKPSAEPWTILEQIIDDQASGLTLQFAVESDGTRRLRIFGTCLPFGNRELLFNKLGEEAGSGTVLSGLLRPTWVKPVD